MSLSEQTNKDLQSKVYELTEVLTTTRDAMQVLSKQMKTEEVKKQSDIEAERARQSQLLEKLQLQNSEQSNKIAVLFS